MIYKFAAAKKLVSSVTRWIVASCRQTFFSKLFISESIKESRKL